MHCINIVNIDNALLGNLKILNDEYLQSFLIK